MTTKENASPAAWLFAKDGETQNEVEFDPYVIDWQLKELPGEMRLELDRRFRTGLGIVTALRGLSLEQLEPKNADAMSAVRLLLLVTLALDLLGHFVSTGFYFVSFIPLALAVAVLLEMNVQQEAASNRKHQLKIHILDLKARWLEESYPAEDFDLAINEMYKFIDCDDQGHHLFRRWWGRLQLQQLCAIRSLANLPPLAQLPSGWDSD
jgi:hypothetical protein